ncbi:hypothetical protein C1I98_07720 [Spongiactinospora gelatinilytica]|uniref:DUF3159 domain-containing protein n=1 Tax=Spongiactinospora gelatinilytica TaxID=2666298 RepID=A0A2W2HAU1_9ACTN|nr:DUF3159 domain-containing protein [Spongiactinospora gelatinilytica]PZG52019.1 hypothetical protein C1I98_07720 [Spongiactinospora gelatinilytica]
MSDLAALRRAGLHIAETAVPVLGFTLVYATTARLPAALATGLCVAALVAVRRVRGARSVWPAVGGFALTAGAAAWTVLSGEAANYFVPVLALRAAVVAATPVMLLLRLPPVGLAAGVLTGRGLAFRRCPPRLRAYTVANLIWVVAEGALLANQARLYLDGRALAMGAFKLLVEVPAHVLLVGLMWAVYRRMTARPCVREGACR